MAQQQQQSGSDNSMAPVWIVILLFITAYFVWALAHQYIVSFVFTINIWQARLVNLFLNNQLLANQIYLMQTLDPNTVNWDQMVTVMRAVGDYMRYPVICILVVLAFVLYNSNVTLKYRKTYDMKSLRAQEQFNWPAIMPIVKEDLVSQDVNKGPWAMALTPMEFARKYNLLRKDDALLDNPVPGEEMTAGIRRGDAKRVFTMQLGPYWDGFERCSPQAYALAAVFIARMNRDRDAANNILKVLDKTFVDGKPDFSVARPVMKKYQNSELVQEVVAKHAYVLTVIASLLEAAREDGVVPSSEFLWLKPVDRRLWYMLNCVGRQTPYSEVAGPFAHWKAEKEMGRRSLVPMIDEAIRALEIAVKEVRLTPRQMEELEP
ncbi:TPA: type IVB secretion system coupling complex protein DotM/IcmP [Legionella pneumophila]|uniref:Component of Dot/Icm secretion system. ATPase component n=1 Tax=Legionella pneumophila subsp. pneumophila TaxID=91891 RepID=A0AAV2UUA9_LEGPN|nr:type IVB secretion system coupling complex protein DotM/IcmP [Legionella pneumophila]MCK1847775.1 type IVB secretion system coupling complex protein DotM/IcmP [Legionella pneumophila]MCZ4804809.1 type IVB secretion system coupling complex protein DotM/IcmP [Legionella pneumophila]MDI9850601.1 type IVB secretion system coupling complex protein DotM/IcmP [Legionella pneumophila]MDO5159674.1 type IVB secretion system coupling complex protein DotM/IcmP [Legionella pneumophila]MDO5162743.1 type 